MFLQSASIAVLLGVSTISNVAGSTVTIHQLYGQSHAQREKAIASGNNDALWRALNREEIYRRAAVRALIQTGNLHTGRDYFEAAYIYQHGPNPKDYLLAMILAETSVQKGYHKARWWVAAALDRYLQSIKQPQVFGTQYFPPWTQQPYNAVLIPDNLRAEFCVPSTREQRKNDVALSRNKPMPYPDGCK